MLFRDSLRYVLYSRDRVDSYERDCLKDYIRGGVEEEGLR